MNKIIITGGASGIGKTLTEGFAQRGYEVFVFDVLKGSSVSKNIHFYAVDLKDENSIKRAYQDIAIKYGVVNVLINNGAISRLCKKLTELESSEFDEVIATNLRGAFLCSREFVRQFKNSDYGRIINIASTRYNQNEADWEAYGASKGGIVSLTNSMCVSLSDTPITVNAVSPGWIQVDGYDKLSKEDHAQHPSGRVGKPEDILKACLYLADEDNDFVNGANIVVDGGMTKKMIYIE